MNYSIGDFIIRIKNAAMAHRPEAVIPYTRVTLAIGEVLVKEGFLSSVKQETRDGHKVIVAEIRYVRRKPVLSNVSVVSKPSLREYVGAQEILKHQGRSITTVLSTNKGVMTGREAHKKGVGGELLFKVW